MPGACAGAVLLTTSVMASLEPCLPMWLMERFCIEVVIIISNKKNSRTAVSCWHKFLTISWYRHDCHELSFWKLYKFDDSR